MKEQKKNKGSVLVAESAYNAQNAQFGLVMKSVSCYIKYERIFLVIAYILTKCYASILNSMIFNPDYIAD